MVRSNPIALIKTAQTGLASRTSTTSTFPRVLVRTMTQKDEQDDEHDEHVKIAFRRNMNVWGDNSTRSE